MDALEAKLIEVKSCMWNSSSSGEESENEFDFLCRRVRIASSLLTYLKTKAVNLSSFDEETWIKVPSSNEDGGYVSELLRSVHTVADFMERLVKRAIMAELETGIEKVKVTIGEEEIRKSALQIETMSVKLDEMERFVRRTKHIFDKMRQRVEDLVEETSRQRERAAENEEELGRVKRDFESLKSYVSSFISVRETLLSSEKQFQTIERLFERLVEKVSQLESDKAQKEGEVKKLMEENVRLNALVDMKEAQLLAMNEQCKLMALGGASHF